MKTIATSALILAMIAIYGAEVGQNSLILFTNNSPL